MKILLTGSTGYIGKRLIPVLLEEGHDLVCCVRDKHRFHSQEHSGTGTITLHEVDFLQPVEPGSLPPDIDVAFYLMHAMTSTTGNFELLEEQIAAHFVALVRETRVRQIIYLSGIANEEFLSPHLRSRKRTEDILRTSGIPLTILRAGIIVGSGSASFEIIRDLVEKLPVMITPKWLNTPHQPVAVRNVIQFLTGVMLREESHNRTYDIGGPDVLSYKSMLLGYAEVRGLRRYIFTLPVMTPRLSSYWLFFVTSTSYRLAINLVDSMKIPVVARKNNLHERLGITLMSYRDAVQAACDTIGQNVVLSSWKDALSAGTRSYRLSDHLIVPEFGCFVDRREYPIGPDTDRVRKNIWSIGGDRGWYYADFLWQLRGFLDKVFGGVGLRRGRTSPTEIHAGDALDFWRVLDADRKKNRLLLFAEMKLPGEAWLEFLIMTKEGIPTLRQTAIFRPKGLFGRIYWYSVLPLHSLIFSGMLRNIVTHGDKRLPA